MTKKKIATLRCGTCVVPGERSCRHEATDSQVCGIYEADGCVCVEVAKMLDYLGWEETPENVEKVVNAVSILMGDKKSMEQLRNGACPLKEAIASQRQFGTPAIAVPSPLPRPLPLPPSVPRPAR
jgi:hypothetical protein